MDDKYSKYIDSLNDDDVKVRLDSLKRLMQGIEAGELEKPSYKGYVNNHIHTQYSFSPYSPAKAIWMAYNAGLSTAGIMDHDSISGAWEFIEAGRIAGMATTIGVECRADFSATRLAGRKLNNPDQASIAYITLHGIPHTHIEHIKSFFKPYTVERNKRNSLMVDKINSLLAEAGIKMDFRKDVVPVSKAAEGGSITERHVLYALAIKLVQAYGKGEALIDFLKGSLKLAITAKVEKYLQDVDNIFYEYDLLGLLKSDLAPTVYVNATSECPDVREIAALAKKSGAIPAYAYLGDVGDSVTGDKRSQKFEDDYLELLFEELQLLGFEAVTYMPSRNSFSQLKRVKGLCESAGFFQISGEDINSPRQSFVCEALQNKEFDNLRLSTWALIGHEKAATQDIGKGMFSEQTISKYPDLGERTKVFGEIGKDASKGKEIYISKDE